MKYIFSLMILIILPVSAIANDYSVDGYGDDGYVYGDVETNGRDIEGYLYKENGDEVYFEGEFNGYGTIDGYDENGDYYQLDVD